MAIGTRSGRLQKDELTNSSRSRTTSGKEEDIKGSQTSGSPVASCSRIRTDSSTSRRTCLGTPTNGTNSSDPVARRSKRLAELSPSFPPDEMKSEGAEKIRPRSPLRRSKRIEEKAPPTSSGSKNSKKGEGFAVVKKKKKNKGSEKLSSVDMRKKIRDTEVDIGSGSAGSKRKKRLDARSYRASLWKLQTKKVNDSDVGGAQEKGQKILHRGTIISGDNDFKELQELRDMCVGLKEVVDGQNLDEDDKEAIEHSSSGSRELAERTMKDDGPGSPKSSKKQKLCFGDADESKCEDNCLASKCSDSSRQSSSTQVFAKEVVDAADRTCCFARDGLGSVDLIESTCEGRSFGVDNDMESQNITFSSKRTKIIAYSDSDVSDGPCNQVLVQGMCTTDDISPSTSGKKNKFVELCTICCKQQRASNDLKDQGICSCNCKTNRDLSNISSSEEVHELLPMLGSPSKVENVASSFQKDNVTRVSEQMDREKSEHQRQSTILADPPKLSHVSLLGEEDIGRLKTRGVVGITGEPSITTQPKDSSQIIQASGGHNACVICKHSGDLLCCDGKGCKGSYHLSCIDPSLKVVPPGIWHCLCCVRKKIELGVHAVSEGMEYVCDARVVDLSGCNGMQKEKQYLVKYKGLAHVHNRWIPEKEMLREALMLVAKFNRRNQKEKVTLWNEDWTVPHRLLQKRLLMPLELSDESFGRHGNDSSHCYYEWFVKWTGLGYEHATWEFENSSFLSSPKAMVLIRDFESRCEEARKASDSSRADKIFRIRQNPFSRLLRLPDACPPGLGSDYLNSVNKLREHWHRAQNAVLIDDQERISKVILFVLSLLPDVSRPFLIISTSNFLLLWESEFMRLAPSVNVVVYNGNKDVRKMIRNLEFYEEKGCMMLRVLLSPPDAVVEDFEDLNFVGWEAIIVDECQRLRVSTHFEHLKTLSSDFRVLLLNSQLKDNIAEYRSLLSVIDSGRNDTVAALAVVKERFFKYVVKERKPDSLRLLEYWVPVQFSNVQLEQYCATLISQSLSLRSCSKIDHVGVVRDLLISIRKCCDHPYIVDDLLQGRLTEGLPLVEYLDVGVKASGKLQVLDKILQEMKGHGQRVVIVFQLIGGHRINTIGDILDDFLRQRFGPDSYERVDSGLPMTKRQSALTMFNNKDNGRFVFLIENRACLPSIKLSSVDAAIIFSSDWNPLNDLRALQKISIDSQFVDVKVFRLYTPFTVEEKVLILAKQDVILESNIPNISRGVSQSLLSWGASYLFNKLDEFHDRGNPRIGSVASEKLLLDDLVSELLAQLPQISGTKSSSSCSIISKAQQSGASYSKEISLLGEKEMPESGEESPHDFWSKLFDGRYRHWRYISGSSQRVRRKVQCHGELPKQPEVENDEARKKRRKVTSSIVGPASLQSWPQDKRNDDTVNKDTEVPNGPAIRCTSGPSVGSLKKTAVSPVNSFKEPGVPGNRVNVGSQWFPSSPASRDDLNHTLQNTTEGSGSPVVESEERKKMRIAQTNLHLLLKPELSKLCQTLQLSEGVNSMAEKFLEYIMNNHHVSRESKTILEAFKISLCWRAASFLKQRVDHKASLALAKKYLNFECTEEEAESVYSKLRMLKKKFSHLKGASRNAIELNSLENEATALKKDNEREPMHARTSASATSSQQELEEGEIREGPKSHSCSEQMLLAEQGQTTIPEIPPVKFPRHIGSLKDDILNKRIILVEKTWSKRQEKLLRKQQVEYEEFCSFREDEKIKQQKKLHLELDLICAMTVSPEVKEVKLKSRKQEILKRMEEFDQYMMGPRRKLIVMHVDARNKEKEIRERWLEEASAGTLAESFDKLPLTDSGFRLGEYKDISGQDGICDVLGNMMPVSAPLRDHLNTDAVSSVQIERSDLGSMPAELPAIILNETTKDISTSTDPAGQSNAVNAANSGHNLCDEMDIGSGTATVAGLNKHGGMEKNKESAILTSTSLQIQTEIPSAQSLTNSGSDNSLSSRQVLSVENERLIVSDALVSGQGLSSSQPFVVPELQSADSLSSLVDFSTNEQLVLGSILPRLPAPADLSSVVIADTSGPTQSRPENTSDMHNYSNQTELSEHQSFEAIAPQAGESDQLITQTAVSELPLHLNICLEGSQTFQSRHVPNSDMNGCSDQAELLGHQSCGTISPQAGESDQPATRAVVNEVPFHMNTPLVRTQSFQRGQVPNGDMHSYANQTELLGQHSSGVAAPQVGESNHVAIQAAVTELPPHTNIPLERSQPENLGSTLREPNNLLLQPFLMTARISPQELQPDPLQNELIKIRKEDDLAIQMHENEKHRLKMELEKELDQVRKKYELLFNDAETKFIERKKTLDLIYNKVHLNQVLAEEFRSKFSENKAAATATSPSPSPASASAPAPAPAPAPATGTGTATPLQGLHPSFMQQFIQVSQPQFVPRPTLVSASVTASTLGPNSVLASSVVPHPDTAIAPAARIRAAGLSAATALVSVPPVQLAHHFSTRFSSNPPVPHHHTPIHLPRGNIHDGSVRAPAPHLHSSRPNSSMPILNFPLQTGGALNQQQLPSNTTTPLLPPRVGTNPPAYPSADAVRGTQESGSSGAVSIRHGTTHSAVSLPVDGGNNRAQLPNLSTSSEMGRWRTSDDGHPPAATDDVGPTALAEVISLIDD